MQQFSLYHASEGSLYKTACQLVEKSYHNKFKIIILTPDIEAQELLNKLIWTYSRKQFIPHGSKLDPLPEKQPIYLTSELENPNQANVLIILAPFNIEEILSNAPYIGHFQRIIIIYEEGVNLDKMINTISNLAAPSPAVKCYKQHPMGTWSNQEQN
ncbi:DNA polymerase III subunit chi [Candidatus Tisiphia endosymbiont of Beris chalybata]|uniref:DNA polymerase III subunit chi n=1 Tax=Candidatus Tisiphia endosymbiont of Beris chalybata TaxID=3066262 RepID=UPI00312C71C4